MDYEERYKEALERARKQINNYQREFDKQEDKTKLLPQLMSAGITALREAFPELRESEDEKALRIIKKRMCYDPVPISDEDRRIVENWLEKQKEQKPAEYLDKDKVYAIMKKLHDLAFSQRILINSDEYKKIGEITSDVRKLLDYPIEQKPEWSEEDEENINSICSYLDNYCRYHEKDGYGVEECKIRKAWLKSLHPSWKPSEEQMGAFKGYIEDFQARAEAAVGGWNNFDVMIQLYEQLKRL